MSKGLLGIVTLYLALTLAYLIAVPVGEAPDEPAHFLYAQYIADTGAPPAKPPSQGDSFWKNGFVTSNYEWYQPPLYYAISAIGLRVGRSLSLTTRYASFPEINPDFPGLMRPLFIAVPLGLTEVHLARFFSMLFGLGTVYITYGLTRRLFPGERWMPELAAGFVAFIPQFTFLHAYVTNDSMAIFASSLTLAGLLGVAQAAPSAVRREWLTAGWAVALAVAVKMTTWYLVPLGLLLAIAQLFSRRRSLAQSTGDFLVYAASALTGLLVSRLLWPDLFQRLLGSPQSKGINPDFAALQHIYPILPMTHTSFWGMFGWVNMPIASPLLWILDGILLIGFVGSAFWLVRQWKSFITSQRLTIGLLSLTLAAVLLAFVYFNLTNVQPQGRYLFPAIASIAFFVARGWTTLLGVYRKPSIIFILLLMFTINVVSLLSVIFPNFDLLAN